LDEYYIRETAKLLRLGERGGPLIEQLEDQKGCIVALCAGLNEIGALRARIESNFSGITRTTVPPRAISFCWAPSTEPRDWKPTMFSCSGRT